MNHAMLDLETLSTEPNAAIVSIGAVAFNRADGILPVEFYQVIRRSARTGHISDDTIDWWAGQTAAARVALDDSEGTGVAAVRAVDNLDAWLDHHKIERLWGNGAAFDNVILRAWYKRAGSSLEKRVPFWADRCYRTVMAMYPDTPKHPRAGTHHNALDDAKWQAERLLASPWRGLNGD